MSSDVKRGMQRKEIAKYIENRVKWWSYSFKTGKNFNGVGGEVLQLTNYEEPTEEDLRKIKQFQQEVYDNTVVTGGCIASMLLGETVNDVDIYLKTQDVARKVAQYYINSMDSTLDPTDKVSKIEVIDNANQGVDIFLKSIGAVSAESGGTADYDYFENRSENDIDEFFKKYRKAKGKDEGPKHSVSFLSSNAITLNNDIQIILRFCGDPSEIHKNFDFVHCTNYWTADTGLVYDVEALTAILERRLYYIGSRFPVASLFRIRKFIERGFRISGGEILKIAYDASKHNLDDVTVLRDQLCGMDLAFFHQVIVMLNDRAPGNAIDRTYLFQIVDRIFKLGETDVDNDMELHDD